MLRKTKAQVIVSAALSAVFLFAQSTPVLAQESYEETIGEIDESIERSEEEAARLREQALTLENKLKELDAEIKAAQASIDKTSLEIRQNERDLKNIEAELARQKAILAENVRIIYRNGEDNALEILASSTSYAEYVQDKEYLESVRSKIHQTVLRIAEIKQELQKRRSDLQELQKEQRLRKAELSTKQQQQTELLLQTEGDEEKFQQILAQLQQERSAAEDVILEFIRDYDESQPGFQPVKGGETVLGKVGFTGLADGPHLHLELIQKNGLKRMNPVDSIDEQKLVSDFKWPVPAAYWQISQPYGCVPSEFYKGACGSGWSFHPGLDVRSIDDDIVAIGDGELIFRGCSADLPVDVTPNKAYGYVAIVSHPDGYFSVYGHMRVPEGTQEYEHCNFNYGF